MGMAIRQEPGEKVNNSACSHRTCRAAREYNQLDACCEEITPTLVKNGFAAFNPSLRAKAGIVRLVPMSPRPVDISQLTPAERLDLIGELWDSLDPSQAPELTPEIGAELDRRSAEAERDPGAGRTWDEVRDELRRRMP